MRKAYCTKTKEIASLLSQIIMNLRDRTGEGGRRQTLCDKRDNNFVCNNFSPNFTFL